MKNRWILAAAAFAVVVAISIAVAIIVRSSDPPAPTEPAPEPAESASDWQWQIDLRERCDADPGNCLVWQWISPGRQDSICQSAEHRLGNFCGDLGGYQRWQLLENSSEYQSVQLEKQAALAADKAAGYWSDYTEDDDEWYILQAVLHAIPDELVREHRIALTFAAGDIIIRFDPDPAD